MIQVHVQGLPENYKSWEIINDFFLTFHRLIKIENIYFDEYVVEYECLNPRMNGKKEHYFEYNNIDLDYAHKIHINGYKIIEIIIKPSLETFRIELNKYFVDVECISNYISDLELIKMDIFFHDDEKDDIFFDHFKQISIDMINEMGLEPKKLERVKSWATKEDLLNPTDKTMIPCFERITSVETNFSEKYDINDGRHRLEYAKELGLTKIMARLDELIYANLNFKE